MKIARKPEEILRRGKVGFVPTMGALHEGHASLVEESINAMDSTIVSIYVNPKQFDDSTDFDKYPRDLESDIQELRELGVDCVYCPTDDIMYPADFTTYVEETELSQILCGRHRPGHFRGVTTVVTRLLNMVRPHTMFLGQKDLQQCLVLKRMAHNLALPVDIKICPTVREFDGLALSSRNQRLTAEQRELAPKLYETLQYGQLLIRNGQKSRLAIEQACQDKLREYFDIDYFSVLRFPDLVQEESIDGQYAIAVAAALGGVRLIDNVIGGFQ